MLSFFFFYYFLVMMTQCLGEKQLNPWDYKLMDFRIWLCNYSPLK